MQSLKFVYFSRASYHISTSVQSRYLIKLWLLLTKYDTKQDHINDNAKGRDTIVVMYIQSKVWCVQIMFDKTFSSSPAILLFCFGQLEEKKDFQAYHEQWYQA